MIHSGAVVAAGVSQGRSTSLKKDFKVCVRAHACVFELHIHSVFDFHILCVCVCADV